MTRRENRRGNGAKLPCAGAVSKSQSAKWHEAKRSDTKWRRSKWRETKGLTGLVSPLFPDEQKNDGQRPPRRRQDFRIKGGPLFAEHLPLREQVDIQQNRTSLFRFYFRQQFLRDVFLSSEDQLYRLYANASRGVSGWVATTIRHFLRVAA